MSKRGTIDRRTLLKGVGAALGLPLLDAMLPSAQAERERAKAPVRMAFLYFPNGVNPHAWTPKGTGRDFELSPILAPLAKVKDDILVLTELMNAATNTGDGHYVKSAAWLTGTTISRTTGADVRSNGVSVDQLAAQRIGNFTPLPSLELGTEPTTTGVDVVVGYTRLYGSHISWSTPSTPVAKEINPKLAFARLFRSGGKQAGTDIDDDISVLDLVQEDAKRLRSKIGQGDRQKLEEYLDSVRAIEKRIAFESKKRSGELMADPLARAEIEKLGQRVDAFQFDPSRVRGKGIDHTEQVRLMLDMMVLAFWTDSTRVSTFMFGNDVSNKNFSFLEGVGGGHHQISHHENDKAKLEEFKRINIWHIQQYAYMLEKMKTIREGEGTLLDNSMVVIGATIRDGNAHNPHNLPIVLGGRGGNTIATGRHLVYPKDTPLCNLYVSMLQSAGVSVPRFADSTGPLKGIGDKSFNGLQVLKPPIVA